MIFWNNPLLIIYPSCTSATINTSAENWRVIQNILFRSVARLPRSSLHFTGRCYHCCKYKICTLHKYKYKIHIMHPITALGCTLQSDVWWQNPKIISCRNSLSCLRCRFTSPWLTMENLHFPNCKKNTICIKTFGIHCGQYHQFGFLICLYKVTKPCKNIPISHKDTLSRIISAR